MAQLKTTFAGLALENPIIISSSGLTNSAEKIKKLEEAGAGAVVLKSVFEEQINMQAGSMQGYGSPEADDYLGAYVRSHALNEHISLIEETKKTCHIPVIASINCYSDSEWVDFAEMMEKAGADALELNILSLQTDKDYTPGSFEQRHIEILRHIKKVVKIPVIMKLGSNFTNPVSLINQLYANGAAAVVLFNRFYQPDIDLNTMQLVSGNVFSSHSDLSDTIRWTAIVSGKIPNISIASSTGVHDWEDVVKCLLAGASAVEMCSAIYTHGAEIISQITTCVEEWMHQAHYESLDQFIGKLNYANIPNPALYERSQFMKYFSNRD